MKDELEQYWNEYFTETRQAVAHRDARLMRMLNQSLSRKSTDLTDLLRRWRAERDQGPRRPR